MKKKTRGTSSYRERSWYFSLVLKSTLAVSYMNLEDSPASERILGLGLHTTSPIYSRYQFSAWFTAEIGSRWMQKQLLPQYTSGAYFIILFHAQENMPVL